MISFTRTRHDKNQPELVATLERLGATVMDLAGVGHGCPDILIGFQGMNYLAEIKAKKKQLSISQLNTKLWWRGGKIHLLRNEQDCIKMLGV